MAPFAGRLRIVQSEMGKELISELSAFEVNYTPSGNLTVAVRARDHYGDLVIASALALWSAVGRPSGSVEVATPQELVLMRPLYGNRRYAETDGDQRTYF
jgi:hypothetical protein